jgi:hypothetical protein
MACRQDESCQRSQQRIHPINRVLDVLDVPVLDGLDGIRQGRSRGCHQAGSDMEQGGLDLLDLTGYLRILIVQGGCQSTEHRIQLVHIAASFEPFVRLAHALAAEKACLAMIACTCIDLDGPPPCFSMLNDHWFQAQKRPPSPLGVNGFYRPFWEL